MQVDTRINGCPVTLGCAAGEFLATTLRRSGYLSVRQGCDTGSCGLCTVWLDGRPVLSCCTLTARVGGREITTIEGVVEEAAAFARCMAAEGAEQCGFCTPGLTMTVLALRRTRTRHRLTPAQELRELLHDADEGLINFDCISPLKPFLGPGFAELQARLLAVIAARYRLPAWSAEDKRAHKTVDVAVAAAEAVHVVGWTAQEVRETLGIRTAPMATDPLAVRYGDPPWRPWTPDVAAARFLEELNALQARAQ